MRHVYWLLPERLAGRPGPTWEPWCLQEIRDAGFDVVLNLSEHAPADEEFGKVHLDVHWTPFPTTVPPDTRAEALCLNLVPQVHSILERELERGRRILVHCVAGNDRTGLLLTYHLARSRGLSPQASLERVRQVRPTAITAQGWEPMAMRLVTKLLSSA